MTTPGAPGSVAPMAHPLDMAQRLRADEVTEQRRSLDLLRASEARFRALSASSPVGIFQTDASGACVYTNERWQEIAGLGAEESLGESTRCGTKQRL